MDATTLLALSVSELRKRLRAAELSTVGAPSVLRARLAAHLGSAPARPLSSSSSSSLSSSSSSSFSSLSSSSSSSYPSSSSSSSSSASSSSSSASSARSLHDALPPSSLGAAAPRSQKRARSRPPLDSCAPLRSQRRVPLVPPGGAVPDTDARTRASTLGFLDAADSDSDADSDVVRSCADADVPLPPSSITVHQVSLLML